MLHVPLLFVNRQKKTESAVFIYLGPVVQSIISLTSWLITNSFTVVAKVFSNSLILFAAKMIVSFAMQKLLNFVFQQKVSNLNVFAILQTRHFNITLPNNVKF